MKDVFISYSSMDADMAKNVYTFLEEHSISCFTSSRDMKAGTEYAEQLITALDECKCVVLILSQSSNDSPHVLREVEYAVSHKKPILVYKIAPVKLSKSMEYFLMTHQWLTHDDEPNEKLLHGIQSILADPQDSAINSSHAKPAPDHKKLICLISAGAVVLVFLAFLILKLGGNDQPKGPDTTSTETNASIPTTAAASTETSTQAIAYRLGDTITLGSYLGVPIQWRIIHINDDHTAVLISSEILCMKAFDTAEGGSYNMIGKTDYWTYRSPNPKTDELLINIRGNNDWSKSNIRTWLNSTSENVVYPDQAPNYEASCEHQNYYSEEQGFLHDFTKEELHMIRPVTNATPANAFSDNVADHMVSCEDYVYLLSSTELSWLTEADVSIFVKPTSQAIAQDSSNYYTNYNLTTFPWWLRDNDGENVSNANMVLSSKPDGSDKLFTTYVVGAVNFGIRPAMTIDLNAYSKSK